MRFGDIWRVREVNVERNVLIKRGAGSRGDWVIVRGCRNARLLHRWRRTCRTG